MKYSTPKFDKKPISKPQNSLLSDEEWAKWLSYFEDSGWKKTSEDIANVASPLHKWLVNIAQKHKTEVEEKVCLICGAKISVRTQYYASYGICKTCYNTVKNSQLCKPKSMWKIDLAENPCSQCGRYGIYDLKNFRCKHCYNSENRIKNLSPAQRLHCRSSNRRAAKDSIIAINKDLQENSKIYESLLIRRDFGFGIN